MSLKSEDLSGISADEVAKTVDDVVSRDEVEAAVVSSSSGRATILIVKAY